MQKNTKKNTSLYQSLTIRQAAKLYPESRACSFFLNGDRRNYYFTLADPIRCQVWDIVSHVKVLKLCTDTGQVLISHIFIKKMDIIEPLSIKEFYLESKKLYKLLKLKYRLEKQIEVKNLITKYEKYGIN